jgi:hypothetical protein
MFYKYLNETLNYQYLTFYQGDKEQLFTNLKIYFCQGKYKFNDLWKTDHINTEMHWVCQRCNTFYQEIISDDIIEKIDCEQQPQIITLLTSGKDEFNETKHCTRDY